MKKVTRPRCIVCAHPERNIIDTHLANAGVTLQIAKQFNLSETTLRRHRTACIFALLPQVQVKHRERVTQLFTHPCTVLAEVIERLYDDFKNAPTPSKRAVIARPLFVGLDQAAKRSGNYVRAAQNPSDVDKARELFRELNGDPDYALLTALERATIIAEIVGCEPVLLLESVDVELYNAKP